MQKKKPKNITSVCHFYERVILFANYFERATYGNLIGWTFEIREACFEYASHKRFQYSWDYF